MEKFKAWEKLAHRYDRQWVQKYSLKPTRKKVISIISSRFMENQEIKILDIGCGTGQLAQCILEKFPFAKYRGVDVTKNMIEEAKKKNLPNADFQQINIEEYENSDTYDIIICTHAFPYFNDKEMVIKKVYNKLKNSGIFILANAAENNYYDLIALLLVKLHTSKAEFLPVNGIIEILENESFKEISINYIKEKLYMPTIFCLYAIKKEDEL